MSESQEIRMARMRLSREHGGAAENKQVYITNKELIVKLLEYPMMQIVSIGDIEKIMKS